MTFFKLLLLGRGKYALDPEEFKNNDDGPLARSCRMGFLMINLTNPVTEVRPEYILYDCLYYNRLGCDRNTEA